MDNEIVKVNQDTRGGLGVINLGALPFVPKRFFWIFDTPLNTARAGHGHTRCEQFLMCQSGKVTIRVTQLDLSITELTMNPGESFYLKTLNWLELLEFSEDAVLGVWASEEYDRSEYIETFDDFLRIANKSH